MVKHARHQSIGRPRRRWWLGLGIGLVVVLLLGGIYMWWSQRQWQQTDRYYDTVLRQSQQLHTQLRSGEAASVEGLGRLRAGLAEASPGGCTPGWLVAWQRSLVPAYRQAVQRCQQAVEANQQRATALDELQRHLKAQVAVATLLEGAQQQLQAIPATDYPALQQAWQQVRGQVSDLPDDSRALRDPLHERVNGVVTAFEQVTAAHQAQDRARLDEALAAVERAYGALGGLQDQVDQTYRQAIDRLLDRV